MLVFFAFSVSLLIAVAHAETDNLCTFYYSFFKDIQQVLNNALMVIKSPNCFEKIECSVSELSNLKPNLIQ